MCHVFKYGKVLISLVHCMYWYFISSPEPALKLFFCSLEPQSTLISPCGFNLRRPNVKRSKDKTSPFRLPPRSLVCQSRAVDTQGIARQAPAGPVLFHNRLTSMIYNFADKEHTVLLSPNDYLL